MTEFHSQVKRLLDGELTLADLPPELRAEGEEALRVLAAVDRLPVTLPTGIDARVMAAVRGRAEAPGFWRRLRLRPWTLVPAFAAGAALALLLSRPIPTPVAGAAVTVRLVLFAPAAQQVAVAGTFNHWDPAATPLVRTGASGVWTATLTLPAGQHQYAFVVDGARWVPDPAAPAVDDDFGGGRRNSVLAL
jgi:hypothetical protein